VCGALRVRYETAVPDGRRGLIDCSRFRLAIATARREDLADVAIAADPVVQFAQHEPTAATVAGMRAIFGTMTADTCGVLAQIVPVLMLTMLFEIRVRKRRALRAGAIVAGFIGNFFVAVLALVLELMLLGGLNVGGFTNAEGLWVWVGILFGIVVLRWVLTSAGFEIINREMSPEKSVARVQKAANLLINFTDWYLNAIASFVEWLFRGAAWLTDQIFAGTARLMDRAVAGTAWLLDSITGERRRRAKSKKGPE
jgi:hypothetical protein